MDILENYDYEELYFKDYDYEKEYFCSPKTNSKHFTKSMYLLISIPMYGFRVFSDYLEDHLDELDRTNEKGWTLLNIAVRNSNTILNNDIVRYLLSVGSNVDIPESCGVTPFNMACMHSSTDSNIDTIKLLLGAKADINKPDINGFTPLMSALNSLCVDVVKLLLGVGVNVDQTNIDGWTALMILSRYLRSHYNNNIEYVKLLLEHGANVNIIDNKGWSALMMASRYSTTDSSIKVVRLLLDYNAYVNINNGFVTALSLTEDPEVRSLLIDHGAEIYYKDTLPLDLMAKLGRTLIDNYYQRRSSKKNYDYVVKSLRNHACEFILRPTSIFHRLTVININLGHLSVSFEEFMDKQFLNTNVSYGDVLKSLSITKDNLKKVKDLLKYPSLDVCHW